MLTALQYKKRVEKIRVQHEEGAGGFTTCGRLSRLADLALEDAHRHTASEAPLAVVALGGYGRRELCFGSDVDTMVLTREDTAGSAMTSFYHAILDFGLDVGHSYRTIEDCAALRHSDLDAWISLLDARFICGDRKIYRELMSRLRDELSTSDLPQLLHRVHTLSDQRHAKYGRSTKLLEPNIKHSSGGLRDAQTVLWLLRVTRSIPPGHADKRPNLQTMLTSSALTSMFPASFLRHARKGLETLFRIRQQMHLNAGGLHDILEFTSQDLIAHALGYRGTGSSSSVERFMADYYEAANTIAEMHSRAVDWTKDRWLRPKESARLRSDDSNLLIRGSRISLASGAPFTSENLLQAYHLRLEPSLGFSYSLEDTLHRRVTSLTAIRSKRAAQLFSSLFTHESGLSDTLRHMNRFGLLARWLPEWRPLVRFFQHNQYHYFTADEHTLTVLEKAEQLRDDSSPFGEAFRSLERKDVLYFACLFHDITKPRRLDDHEVTGAALSRTVLSRFRLEEIADDVAFLVRNHLVMEQIAFRRNLGDPVTIRDFAALVSRPELLRYLYVLTYSDLAAVNTHVLTDWKKALLTELYMKTLSFMREKEGVAPSTNDIGAEELIHSLSVEAADPHTSLLRNDAYRRTFSPTEITEHMEALKDLSSASTIFHHWSDVTDLTLLTTDAPFVLARVCGAIYANDLNIIDARIFTRDDGIVIDSFKIIDSQRHKPLTEDQCIVLAKEIEGILSGNFSVDDLLERHRKRWKRRSSHVNQNVRVDVAFEEHPHYTIIDVYGADAAGFLYAVSDTISDLGCTIHFAKIATRGDGIVDAFYVRDTDGKPIATDARRHAIRTKLLKRLEVLYGRSLQGRKDRE